MVGVGRPADAPRLAVSRRSKRFGVADGVLGRSFCGMVVPDPAWAMPLAAPPGGGCDLRVKPGGEVFVRVNQVLVRLWARCVRMSDRMWLVLRDGSSRARG